jgi:DNA-binding FadR family transcriptional regulator
MTTAVETARTQASSANAIFDRLLREIVSGVYPPGARLPAERELSRLLGASRPTLREALLGSISSVYTGIAAALSDAALPPADYVTTYLAMFDALESGLTEEACKILESYFQRHDRRLLAAWGIG